MAEEEGTQQRSYGLHARLGEDDMTVVNALDLPTDCAYTPDILKEACAKAKARNIVAQTEVYEAQGMSKKESLAQAKIDANAAEKKAKENIRKEQVIRGY